MLDVKDLNDSNPHIRLRRALNICPRYNVIYITNQKCGCTTFKLLLMRAETGDWDLDPSNIHKEKGRLLPRIRDIGRTEVSRMLGGGAMTFSFVRNPVSRFLSVYREKIVGKRPQFNKVVSALGRDEISVDGFLDFLDRQDPLTMDPHWRPQHINLMMDSIDYTFIGKLENFDEDHAKLCEITGLPGSVVAHRNNRSKSPAPDLTADQVKRVERIYAGDFEAFGY